VKKMKSLGWFLFLGFAVLTPVFSWAASEPVTLTCVKDGTSAANGTFQLILDDGAKTAAFAENPVSPAVFTATTVKWKVDITRANYHLQLFYRFNRQTSVLIQTSLSMTALDGKEKNSHGTNTYHCSAAQ
jgi:hypothetical protein